MSTRTSANRSAGTAGWPVPAALVALSLVPLIAGTLRLIQLAGGPAVRHADPRFTGFPVALVVHIVGALVYALVGAFQFVPPFRRRHFQLDDSLAILIDRMLGDGGEQFLAAVEVVRRQRAAVAG